MSREFSQAEADLHNRLYRSAHALIDGQIYLDGATLPGRVGFFTRRKLQRALDLFRQALEINPEGWPSMYAIGKIHQRLGDSAAALEWFSRASALEPENADLIREAALAAMDCGDGPQAVRLSETALAQAPDDAGLLANLALAHLIAGDLDRAAEAARQATERAPDDPVSQNVATIIGEVRSGKRAAPKRLIDISAV